MVDFQELVLKLQLAKEDVVEKATKYLNNDTGCRFATSCFCVPKIYEIQDSERFDVENGQGICYTDKIPNYYIAKKR